MTQDELNRILENHKKWLEGDPRGVKANLRNVSLVGASLVGATLDYASLDYASLVGASLEGASLNYASLDYASLNGASLNYASLVGASLDRASLDGASLVCASLGYASLDGATLVGASLDGVSLNYASLVRASLNGASLDGVKGLFVPMTCPSEGSFISWKKCSDDIIVKLLIPDDAKRSSATGRKCRADKAVVLAMYDSNGNAVDTAYSMFDKSFVYKVGETVKPEKCFDDNRWNECGSGIHFFITREEAESY